MERLHRQELGMRRLEQFAVVSSQLLHAVLCAAKGL